MNYIPDSLLRVGRFDKNFKLESPTSEDAEKIIAYYLSKKKFVDTINVKQIARILSGYSCAQLETVINEAGIYTGYENKEKFEMNDIIKAAMRVIYKAPEVLSQKENRNKKLFAYHEAGHAVVAEVLEKGSVNIVSVKTHSGNTGGVTSYYQDEDYFFDKKFMENRVLTLLGGKSATEIVFGVVDVGANNDIHRARDIVERFVDNYCSYGFDKFAYARAHSNEFIAKQENLIFSEMERYYQLSKKILIQNREFLDKLASALIEKETLITEDIKKIKESCKIVECNF